MSRIAPFPPSAGAAPMNFAVESYLEGLDAHLTGVGDCDKRISLLEGERRRVDRLERALGDWALCDRNRVPQPTRFSAFDLALLHGALTVRLEAVRAASPALNPEKSLQESRRP